MKEDKRDEFKLYCLKNPFHPVYPCKIPPKNKKRLPCLDSRKAERESFCALALRIIVVNSDDGVHHKN